LAIPGFGCETALLEFALDNAVAHVSGQFGHEFEIPGYREVWNLGDAELHELLVGRAGALDEDDARLHLVFTELAGNGVDGDLSDERVRSYCLFELERGDVLTSPADGVLDSSKEGEIAILVDAPEITGVEPQVSPRFDRGRIVVEVLGEHDVRLPRPA